MPAWLACILNRYPAIVEGAPWIFVPVSRPNTERFTVLLEAAASLLRACRSGTATRQSGSPIGSAMPVFSRSIATKVLKRLTLLLLKNSSRVSAL